MYRKLGSREAPSSKERSLFCFDHEKRMQEERTKNKLAQFSQTVTLFARDDKVFGTGRDDETSLGTIDEGVLEEAAKGGEGGGGGESSSSIQESGRGTGKKLQETKDDDPCDKPDGPLFTMPTIPKNVDKPKLIPSFDSKYLLFHIRLTLDDVKQGSTLFIPVETTLDNDFLSPPKRGQPKWEKKIRISDIGGRVWSVKVGYSYDECGFLIDSEWWQGFYESHSLVVEDVIGFYADRNGLLCKSTPNKHQYLIKRETYKSPCATFKKENFKFQWLLSQDNIIFGWLNFDERIVGKYFPVIRIPRAETHHKERLYFIDNHNREWSIQIRYQYSIYTFHLDEILKKHKAKAGDVLRFFVPVEPLTSRHYLIQHLIYDLETSNLTLPPQPPPPPPGGVSTTQKDKHVKIGDKVVGTGTGTGTSSSSSKQVQLGSSAGKEQVKRNDYLITRDKSAGTASSSSKRPQSGTSASNGRVRRDDVAGPSRSRRNDDDRRGGEQSGGSSQRKKKLIDIGGFCVPFHGRKRSDSSSD